MHSRDPKDLSQSSQSLDDVIRHVKALYKDSPLPFCIRDQYRNTVYKNDACSDFFHPLSGKFSGESFDPDMVEIELSSIELESFIMGPNTAACRSFNFNGEFYQLRIEVRSINDEMYTFWTINFFPDYQALFNTSYKTKKTNFDVDVFLAEFSTKAIITLCFSVLGFNTASISKYLGVSEKAVSKRLARIKFEVNKHFSCYEDFRIYCLEHKIYSKFVFLALNLIGVK